MLFKIKGKVKKERKDNTENIKNYIEQWLAQNSILYRRIRRAFPNFDVFKKLKDK